MCLRALSALMAVTWWVALLPSLSGTFLFSVNQPARPLMWQTLKLKCVARTTSSLHVCVQARAIMWDWSCVFLWHCVGQSITTQGKKTSPAALTTAANKPLQSPFSPSSEQQMDRNKSSLFMFNVQGQNRRKTWGKRRRERQKKWVL